MDADGFVRLYDCLDRVPRTLPFEWVLADGSADAVPRVAGGKWQVGFRGSPVNQGEDSNPSKKEPVMDFLRARKEFRTIRN